MKKLNFIEYSFLHEKDGKLYLNKSGKLALQNEIKKLKRRALLNFAASFVFSFLVIFALAYYSLV